MNEPDEYLSDEHLDRLLQPHRDINVPPEAQAANRAAIRQQVAPRTRLPWWKRTIALPVPVAIAASILLLLAAAAVLRPLAFGRNAEQPSPIATIHQADNSEKEPNASNELSVRSWRMQRSYIRTLTSSTTNEPVAFHALEDRDDS